MNGLIVGCGSAGRQYLKAGISLGHTISVVERQKSAFQEDSIRHLDFYGHTSLESLNESFDYAIVATPSEYHLEIARDIIEHVSIAKCLVVEKLIANSLKELEAFDSLIKTTGKLKFLTHNRWALLGVPCRISQLCEVYQLGRLISFNSIGGGMCIASGSIHWLSSFYEIFEIDLENFQILGDVSFSPQGKRPHLDYVEGRVEFRFPTTSINFSYNPRSHITPTQIFLFEHGAIVLQFSGEYQVVKGDPEKFALEFFRYKVCSIVETGNMYNVDANPFFNLLLSIQKSEFNATDFQNAINASKLIIYSLHLASVKKITKENTNSIKSDTNAYSMKWRVS